MMKILRLMLCVLLVLGAPLQSVAQQDPIRIVGLVELSGTGTT